MPAILQRALLALALLLGATASRSSGEIVRGYGSEQEAFTGAFIDSGIARRSYEENREFAAAIYLMPDGRWYTTPVATGGRTGSAIPYHDVPGQALQVAGAHTHGAPAIPEDPGREYGVDFSPLDRRNALLAYQQSRGRIAAQWLVSSRLEVLRMTISQAYDPRRASIGLSARIDRLGSLPGLDAAAGPVIALQRAFDAMDR